MIRRRAIPALALASALAATGPGVTRAAAVAPAQTAPPCPTRTICASTLGIAVTPPSSWIRLTGTKTPPHMLSLARPGGGLSYTLRLVIEPYAITSTRNDAQAAALVAGKLITAERVRAVTRRSVTYGGAPGVLIRGLPGGSGPALDLILARRGYVYLIIIPGARIAPDQRQALASLRFIPRAGHFLPPVGGAR